MPFIVHKILPYGSENIEYFSLIPIEKLSEEVAAARKKEFVSFENSRKFNRQTNNEDLRSRYFD